MACNVLYGRYRQSREWQENVGSGAPGRALAPGKMDIRINAGTMLR